MTEQADWLVWVLAAAVVALFVAYFWWTGRTLVASFRRFVAIIQDWPQTRRAMVEQEARAGGRFPLWLRTARVLLVITLVGLMAYLVVRRFG